MAEHVSVRLSDVQENHVQPHRYVKQPNFKMEYTLGHFSTPVSFLKFSPDGKHLASVHNGSNLSVWDIEKRDLWRSCNDKGDITTMSWTHDSSIILTGNTRGELSLWDRARGKVLSQLRSNMSYITCSDFNSISTLAVSGLADGTIFIYDVRSALPLAKYSFHAAVTSVCFSPTNNYIAATCADGTAYIVDAVATKFLAQFVSRGGLPFTSVKFTPDRRHIITTCLSESKIRVWHITSRKCVKTYSGHKSQSFNPPTFAYYENGPWIVSGSEDEKVYIWNFRNGGLLQTLNHNYGPVLNVDIHPTKEIIAAGLSGLSPSVKIWKQDD